MSGRGDGIVRGQGASYRNGLVLGLTMAEILLLLLFCMLVALGAAMQAERQARRDVEARLAAAEATAARTRASLEEALKAAPGLAESMATGAAPSGGDVDAHWRRLVEGVTTLDALEGAGLSRERLREDAGALAETDKALRAAGGDPGRVARDAALGARARKAFADAGATGDDDKVAEATARGAGAARGDGRGHRWPPIISLSEADGFTFASGRAEVEPEVARKLAQVVVPKVLELVRQYEVDTLEVVGHTDEQPMGGRSSNLDRGLPLVLRGQGSVAGLGPSDNAGLGLARAVAVVARLSGDKRLADLRILPLSGGQLIGTDQRLADGTQPGDVRQRRRIEIRLRQSGPSEVPRGGGFLPSWIRLPGL